MNNVINFFKSLFFNIFIILILLSIIYFVSMKYLYKFNAYEAIYNFNKSYNDLINKFYLYMYYNPNTQTLTTNYELNNGLLKDIKYNLDIIDL